MVYPHLLPEMITMADETSGVDLPHSVLKTLLGHETAHGVTPLHIEITRYDLEAPWWEVIGPIF